MKRGKIISIIVGIALISTFALTYINKTKEDISGNMLNSEGIAVLVEKLSKGEYGEEIKYSGSLGYGEEKNIISMVDEKVTYVGVKEGDYVKEGQVLVELDSSKINENINKAKKEYESALEKANKGDEKLDGIKKKIEEKKKEVKREQDRVIVLEGQVKQLENNLKALEEEQKNNPIDEKEYLEKVEKLNREKSKVEMELGKANINLKRYRLEIVTIEKSLESLGGLNLGNIQVQASKKMYEEMLKLKENYIVKSPSSGKVISLNAYIGEKVENKMLPIVTIGREDIYSLNFTVDEEEKELFKVGEEIEVSIEKEGKEQKEKGRVKAISRNVDMRTERHQISVEIPNNNNYKIDSYASLYKKIDKKKNTNMISKNALLREANGDFVYIVEDGKAKKVQVTLGKENNNSVEIAKGLKSDDVVVVRGKEYLKDGREVYVMEGSN